jgi:hypothetical protein
VVCKKGYGEIFVSVPIGSIQPLEEKAIAYYKTGYKYGTVAQGHKVHFHKNKLEPQLTFKLSRASIINKRTTG